MRRLRKLRPRSLAQIEALLDPPDPQYLADAQQMMDDIDRQGPKVRALVHEFGVKIVSAMLDEGYGEHSADELHGVLVRWREGQQEKWLATDYITDRVGKKFREALARKVQSVADQLRRTG